jgi:hypothetical protein
MLHRGARRELETQNDGCTHVSSGTSNLTAIVMTDGRVYEPSQQLFDHEMGSYGNW